MEYARIMTRYLCAPDSFKESLTAMQAAEAMARGIENADRDAEIRCLPMADGGEGTVRALVDATGGTMHAVPVHDPLGRLIEGRFGVLADGATAVVETAEASGLARLNAEERDPLIASSYGTGELLLAAARLGVRRIIVGLGGSATNDAGAGLLQSLGVRLLDANGDELGRGGAALADVSVIDITTMDPAIGNVSIIAACDVTNPLTGPTGASAVFGPQKGAGADDVVTLDAALAHFARLIESRFGVDVSDVPGAGAAGGIGAALKGFFGAEFRSGVDIVIEQSGLDEAVRWADVVFTGEGAIDAQTGFGKAPSGVGRGGQTVRQARCRRGRMCWRGNRRVAWTRHRRGFRHRARRFEPQRPAGRCGRQCDAHHRADRAGHADEMNVSSSRLPGHMAYGGEKREKWTSLSDCHSVITVLNYRLSERESSAAVQRASLSVPAMMSENILLSAYPARATEFMPQRARPRTMEFLKDIVTAFRSCRAENGLAPVVSLLSMTFGS